MTTDKPLLTALSARIVAAYVRNNPVAATELPTVISTVYGALADTLTPPVTNTTEQKPAVPIRRAGAPDGKGSRGCGPQNQLL